ncbi:MAG: hypothetical protein M1837_003534 [Sclerophora amabilis]|nr:MAG: hypothetical protein M1837_003534 [Sclerophora amabilis]
MSELNSNINNNVDQHESIMDRFQSDTSSRLEQMLARAQSFSPGMDHVKPPARLNTTGPDSMALTGASHTLLSSQNTRNVPSLTTESSLASSPTDSDPDRPIDAATIDGYPLLECENGALVLPTLPPARLECPFNFIGCYLTFTSFGAWLAHSTSHFGDNLPPVHAICCLCDMTFHAPADPVKCWEARMRHVAQHHKRGLSLSTARPDFALIRYLREKELISERDHNRLVGVCERTHTSPGPDTMATAGPAAAAAAAAAPAAAKGYRVPESREEQRRRRQSMSRRSRAAKSRQEREGS